MASWHVVQHARRRHNLILYKNNRPRSNQLAQAILQVSLSLEVSNRLDASPLSVCPVNPQCILLPFAQRANVCVPAPQPRASTTVPSYVLSRSHFIRPLYAILVETPIRPYVRLATIIPIPTYGKSCFTRTCSVALYWLARSKACAVGMYVLRKCGCECPGRAVGCPHAQPYPPSRSIFHRAREYLE